MQGTLVFERDWQQTEAYLKDIEFDIDRNYDSNREGNKQSYKLRKNVLAAQDNVFKLCNNKPSYKDMVYQKYRETLKRFLITHEPSWQSKIIKNFNTLWEKYLIYSKTISKRVFSYLDRYYTQALDQGSLMAVAVTIFQQNYLQNDKKTFFINNYIIQLGKIRDKLIISHRQLLKFTQCFAIIGQLTLFPQLIEIHLKQTNQYYKHLFNKSKELKPFQYYHYINNILYFQEYLDQQSINMPNKLFIVKLFQNHLVMPYTDTLISHEKGLRYFLKTKNVEAIKIICDIYKKFEGFQKIRECVYNYVLELGRQLFKQQNSDQFALIDKFYNFHIETEKQIAKWFNGQQQILITLKNSFQKLIGQNNTISAQFFKKTRLFLDTDKLDENIVYIKKLFDLLPSKDEFLHLYQQSIEDKILKGKFIYYIQKKFVQLMTQILGSQIVAKIDKKIEDFVSFLPICSEFNNQSGKKINFHCVIMGLGFWQKRFNEQITFNMNLVKPLETHWNNFCVYFTDRQCKRKLQILPFESNLVLIIQFPKGQVKLKCNLFQACIIFYLAQAEKRTELDIIRNLLIQKDKLYQFLETAPSFIRELETGGIIFNWDFQPKDYLIDLEVKTQESVKISQSMMQDRDILIEAAIVKTIKKQKNMTFEQIVQEIHKRIKLFRPLPHTIKVALKNLNRKQLVQEDQTKNYSYIE